MTTGSPIYLVSACTSGEEFVAAFRRYADRNGLFVPIAEPIAVGKRGRFAVTLTGGGIMIEGDGEVISSARTPSVLHGRVGMTIRFSELDAPSKTVIVELEKARLTMRPPPPSVPPRPAEIPAEPRPVPPAPSGRIDANNALAQCVVIGDVDSLPAADPKAPPKFGPKFVVPVIPPVAGARTKAASTPPPGIQIPRTKPASIPPAIPSAPVRAKPPTPEPVPIPQTDDGLPGAQTATMTAVKPVSEGGSLVQGAFSETMPAIKLDELLPDPAAPRETPTTMSAVPVPQPTPQSVPVPSTTPAAMAAVPPPAPSAQIMEAVMPPTTPTGMTAVTPTPSAELAAVAPPPTEVVPAIARTATATDPMPLGATLADPMPMAMPRTHTEVGVAPPVAEPPPAVSRTATVTGTAAPLPRTATPAAGTPPAPSAAPPPIPRAAMRTPSAPAKAAASVDLDEPTETTAAIPAVEDEPPARTTTLGVAVSPTGATVLPATVPATATPPQAVRPNVEEPTPSGDWTMTPGDAGPKIEPRKPPRKEPTGDWTISIDSSRPDGWSEPSKVDVKPYRDPKEPPAPVATEPPKAIAKDPSRPHAPRVPTRSIEMRDRPAAPILDEPKVQIDPTLIEPLTPLPVESLAEGSPAAASPSHQLAAASSSGNLAMATPMMPMPPMMAMPAAPDIPAIANAPARMGSAPHEALFTPLPGSIANATSPTAAYQGMQMQAIGLTPRMVTDGGTGFFRESGDIPNLATGDSTSIVKTGGSKRRLVVIIASAALAVIAGVIALVVLTRDNDDAPAAAPPPADAAVAVVKAPADAAVVEAAPDAAVVAAPECFVEITSVPAGADIVRDKDVLATAPAKLPLPCGDDVKLTIRKAKYAAVTRSLTPTPEGAKLKVTLPRLQFTVKVSSVPAGATITVNGKSLGVTPTVVRLPAFELSTLTLTKDGYVPDTQKIAPKQNNQALQSQLKKKPKTR